MATLGRFRFEFEEAEDGGLIVSGELSGPGGEPMPFGPIVLGDRQVDQVVPLVQGFFDILGSAKRPGMEPGGSAREQHQSDDTPGR